MHSDPVNLFVPGRLCLLGEHSDWAASLGGGTGSCLVTGTPQGIRAEASALEEPIFSMSAPTAGGREEIRVPLSRLAATVGERGYFSYAAGVALEMRERFVFEGGVHLHVTDADLPVRKGLSSSAAACVLVARAFDRVLGLGLSVEDEMDLAYRGERRAGSPCGRMDQVCALGTRPSLLGFEGDAMSVTLVAAGAALSLLLVDLQAGKDTRRILADLQGCYPAAPGPLAAGVREALGPRNAELVRAGTSRVEAGDARGLGEVMTEAQRVFDEAIAPACPELAAPALHAVLEAPEARELGWGGKGVGSQGDGCAQLVARSPQQGRELARRLEARLPVRCIPLSLGEG